LMSLTALIKLEVRSVATKEEDHIRMMGAAVQQSFLIRLHQVRTRIKNGM
jgi:hypothetical protein